MQGWIKLHRELLNKAIWTRSTPEQKSILITLLMMANHKEKEWEWQSRPYKCKSGEFITSLERIKEHVGKGVSIQNIRTALKKFSEKYQFLTYHSTNIREDGTKIKITNWEFYQNEVNKENNRLLADDSHTTNIHLTTNKNDKNEIKDSHKDKLSFGKEFGLVKLTKEEYGKLNNLTLNNPLLDQIIDDLDLNLASGKEQAIKCHYARLLTYLKHKRNIKVKTSNNLKDLKGKEDKYNKVKGLD